MDMIIRMLMIEDYWKYNSIKNELKGVKEEREGMFEKIKRSKKK
jgi:hypothetical protein